MASAYGFSFRAQGQVHRGWFGPHRADVPSPSATPADETEFASIQAELDGSTSLVLEEMQTTTVATSAAADGTYTLWFVSPGTYDVSASATIGGTLYSDGPQVVPVSEDEDVTTVDFDL